jgi:hypothetical protein
MKYKLTILDQADDEAYRARLAPLAEEVLPKPPRSRKPPRPPRTRRVLPALAAIGGVTAIVAGLAFAWPHLKSVWPGAPVGGSAEAPAAHVAGRNGPAAPVITGPPTDASNEAPAAEGRVAGRTGPGARVIAGAPSGASAEAPAAEARTAGRIGSEAPERVQSGGASAPRPPEAAVKIKSAAMIGMLIERGDAALAEGDVIAARMLFERAASLGSASAATSAGKTYDIEFLLRIGARGIRADPAVAAAWFRKAAALGDPDARDLVARMDAQSRSFSRP